MDLQLSHKHILITGGSKGIGLACARGFLREGAKVSLVGRNVQTLAGAMRTLADEFADAPARVGTFSADLQDASQAQRALDEAIALHGAVDVLVNSAGAARRTPPDELTPQAWRDAMDAKYFSYTNMIDPVIRQMGRRGSGAIVNVVGAGGKMASAIHLPGGAANAALMLISAGLASAYAARGVRVNAVNPGGTLTDRLTEGLQARVTSKVPMGRLAEPSEVADAVLYLASARASYVTGVIMTMDGGSAPMVV